MEFIVGRAPLDYHFAVVFPTTRDVGRNQPAAVKFGRSHSGSPGGPLRRVQGSIFGQIIEGLIHQRGRILLNLSDHRGVARSEKPTAEGDVGLRIEKHVHVGQQFPVFLRAAPG